MVEYLVKKMMNGKKKYEKREREKLKGTEERMRKQVEEKRVCWVM